MRIRAAALICLCAFAVVLALWISEQMPVRVYLFDISAPVGIR